MSVNSSIAFFISNTTVLFSLYKKRLSIEDFHLKISNKLQWLQQYKGNHSHCHYCSTKHSPNVIIIFIFYSFTDLVSSVVIRFSVTKWNQFRCQGVNRRSSIDILKGTFDILVRCSKPNWTSSIT